MTETDKLIESLRAELTWSRTRIEELENQVLRLKLERSNNPPPPLPEPMCELTAALKNPPECRLAEWSEANKHKQDGYAPGFAGWSAVM